MIVTDEKLLSYEVRQELNKFGGQTAASKDPAFYDAKEALRKRLRRRSLVLIELLPKPAKVVVAYKNGQVYKI